MVKAYPKCYCSECNQMKIVMVSYLDGSSECLECNDKRKAT